MPEQHSVHVDRIRNPKGLPAWMLEAGSAEKYTISLHVEGVADEHASYVAQTLFILQRLFTIEGSGVETVLSASKAKDAPGVERIYDLIPDAKA